MKKYSPVLDNLILAAMATREGKPKTAANYLAKAAEMDGFEEEVDFLDDANNEAFDQDVIGDDLMAEDTFAAEDEEDLDVEGSDETLEVSDEEALAQAMASLQRRRSKVRASALNKRKSRPVIAEEGDDDFIADGEAEESEESVEEETEEVSAAVKRRQRQLANLKQIRASKAKTAKSATKAPVKKPAAKAPVKKPASKK